MINLPPGELVDGKYQVLGKLGKGSAGTVYRALQENVGRQVALKVLSVDLAEHPTMVERFRREAYNVSQLKHPNTVTVFDYGFTGECYYIAMELLDGETLGRLMARAAPLPVDQTVRILGQVLRALDEAHKMGLVHRDLKPDNIFLADVHGEQDFVKVLDFGIAKALDDHQPQLTEHGMVFGTPRYMAPEQATGQTLSPATDVYAVGLILYEMLSGQVAFEATTMYELLNKQVFDPVPLLEGELAGGVFDELIQRATAKRPSERFASAGEFWEHLRAASQEHAVEINLPTVALGPVSAEDDDAPQVIGVPRPDGGTRMISAVETGRVAPTAPGPPAMGADVPTVLGEQGPPGDDPRRQAGDAGTTLLERFLATAHERPALELTQAPPFEPMAPIAPSASGALLGREDELDALLEQAQRLVQGLPGAVAVITGAPGAGKSHLLRHALTRLQDIEELPLGVAAPGAASLPLGTMLSALRDLRSEARDPDGIIYQRTDSWLHEALGPGQALFDFFVRVFDERAAMPDASTLAPQDAGMLLEATGHLLVTLVEQGPLLLVLDDGLGPDDWTLHLLERLAEGGVLAGAPLGLWVTARDGALLGQPVVVERLEFVLRGAGPDAVALALGPLYEEDAVALLKTMAPMDSTLLEAIGQLAEGLPGPLEACAVHACDGGAARWSGARWTLDFPLEPPPELRQAIEARLEALSPPDPEHANLQRVILQWVAVMGPVTSRAALNSALRRDPRATRHGFQTEAIATLTGAGVLTEEDGGLRAPLGLVVACARLGFNEDPRAVELHGIAYDVRKTIPWSDAATRDLALGAHLLAAERAHLALEHLADGADEAWRLGHLRRAEEGYREVERVMSARDTPPDDTRRMILATSRAEVMLHLGQLGAAEGLLLEIEERCAASGHHRNLHSRVCRLLGILDHRRGRLESAVERLQELLEPQRLGAPVPATAEALWTLGGVGHALGERALVERVVERLDGLTRGTEAAVAVRALLGLGLIARLNNDGDGAQARFEAALERHGGAAPGWPQAMAQLHLGHLALERAQGARAGVWLEQARTLADRVGARTLEAEASCALARLAMEGGLQEMAEEHLRMAWALIDGLELPWHRADVLAAVAEWLAHQENLQRARARRSEALMMVRALGLDPKVDPHWRHALGRVEARLDR